MWYRKLWIKIKKYWWLSLIAIGGIFLMILFGYHPDDIKRLLKRKQRQADEELKAVEGHAKNTKEKSDKNLEEYFEEAEELDKDYEKNKEEIREKTKEDEKEFLLKVSEDPEGAAEQIAKQNDWEFIK